MYELFRDSQVLGMKKTDENNCCGECDSKGTECDCPLAMVFINSQPLDNVYPLAEGFSEGTIFPNLNKPFLGGMLKWMKKQCIKGVSAN